MSIQPSNKQKNTPRIILASRSPARKRLMEELKIPFECHASEIDEDMSAKKDPYELAMLLASQKAQAVTSKYPNSIIIGVDTFVIIGKEKIGKPSSIKEATTIIKKMSGKTISVISGMAVIKTDAKGKIIKTLVSNATTFLKIKKMTPTEITFLASQKEALQLSGAFSIEGEGGKMVEGIFGDYNNVIGLPINQLKEMLEELKVKLKSKLAPK
jgi:septum formation protein